MHHAQRSCAGPKRSSAERPRPTPDVWGHRAGRGQIDFPPEVNNADCSYCAAHVELSVNVRAGLGGPQVFPTKRAVQCLRSVDPAARSIHLSRLSQQSIHGRDSVPVLTGDHSQQYATETRGVAAAIPSRNASRKPRHKRRCADLGHGRWVIRAGEPKTSLTSRSHIVDHEPEPRSSPW